MVSILSSEYDQYSTIYDSSTDNFKFTGFENKKVRDVMTVTKEDKHLDPNSKVPCTNCTNKFFEIFFKDTDKYQNDPIMQDILSKEVYMNYDKVNKCWRCAKCGNFESSETNIIIEPNKKLKAFGQSSYSQYNKVTKSKPDYIQSLNKKRVDINNLFRNELN